MTKWHHEEPALERNSGAVFLWMLSQCQELVKPDLSKALSHILTEEWIPTLSHDSPHLFMAETFYPVQAANRTQADPSQFYYTTVSAAQCLLRQWSEVEGGDWGWAHLSRETKPESVAPLIRSQRSLGEYDCKLRETHWWQSLSTDWREGRSKWVAL